VFTRQKETTHELDESITKLIEDLKTMDAGDEIHTNAVASLKTLMETRAAEQAVAARSWVSPDAIVSASAHLVGIAMILGFEKANVLTSKGLGFVPRMRT
jgi:hypothetical protein